VSATQFTHLHLHSQYSLLDGAIKLKELMPALHAQGMSSVAVTDHGNLYGVIDFYTKAKDAGIKPIIGVETYVCDDMKDRTHRHNHHLILLCENDDGYRNLRYLNSQAFIDGFYYHPRIDKRLLKAHSAGLIGLSACLGGELSETYYGKGYAGLRDKALEYADCFAPGNFYLEVQPNGLERQRELNDALLRLSNDTGLPIVATGDCHYLRREDAKAHEVLMAIQTRKELSDEARLSHGITSEYYLKSEAEFNAAFPNMPQALENTAAIAARCNVNLKLGKPRLPKYDVPGGIPAAEYLRQVAREGLESRFHEILTYTGADVDRDKYRAQLEYELGVIIKMDFPGYFLIVHDFIKYAHNHGIPVGPGRGSGAGSLVAYSLRITDLDPIKYGLMFERFLNPDRVSMPDFDIDFCMRERKRVIRYLQEKYGNDRVAQIVTFTTLSAKSGIKAVGKVYGMPFDECSKLTDPLPTIHEGHPPTVKWALENEPSLSAAAKGNPIVAQVLDVAGRIDGLIKTTGVHAAGVVIADAPLWDAGVPAITDRETGALVTQFGMEQVEKAGLIKFDFLGLKNLTAIRLAVDMIRRHEPDFDLRKIPLNDRAVFGMISQGDTAGVFQLGEAQMRALCAKLKPDRLEDIFAIISLYRPGPIEGGMIPDFIDRKHGRKPIVHLHPALADVLGSTYGVIVYQEQVMQVARVLAGFTLAQADNLRRVMGKKKRAEIDAQKELFIAGCKKVGICDAETADKICELIAVFAGYGFNLAHAAAYGLIGYQTAYLKYHYPEEFLASLASCDADDQDKLLRAIASIKRAGVVLLGPCVNKSADDFTVEVEGGRKSVRLGLRAIKGLGDAAVSAIVEGRANGKPYSSIWDFCARVDLKRCGKKVIETLINCGALDELFIPSRAVALKVLDAAIARGAQEKKSGGAGQMSLMSFFGAAADANKPPPYPRIPEMPADERLRLEKEALGFYRSGHPLDAERERMSALRAISCADLTDIADRTEVHIAGIVTGYEARALKGDASKRMCRFTLEDPDGEIECVVFSRGFAAAAPVLESGKPVFLTGTIVSDGDEDAENRKQKVLVRQVLYLESAKPPAQSAQPSAPTQAQARDIQCTAVEMTLKADVVTEAKLQAMKAALLRNAGQVQVSLILLTRGASTSAALPAMYRVHMTDALLRELETIAGDRRSVKIIS
jgi:DNA polymerase-3 subunit alpha